MKKNVLILVLVIGLTASGCKPTTIEKRNEQEKSNNSEKIEYTKIEDMDFSTGHVEGVLQEGINVDAYILSEDMQECGIYELANKKVDLTELEYAEKMDGILDNYFGRDITTSYVDQQATSIFLNINSFYNGNIATFYDKYSDKDSNDYSNYHSCMRTNMTTVYEMGSEYDKAFVDEIVNRIIEEFSEILPDNVGARYECLYLGEDYEQRLIEKYGEEVADSFYDLDLGYYVINMYSEIEDDVFFKGIIPKSYDTIEGEILDEVCVTVGYEDVIESIQSHNPQCVEMIITEEGELVSLRINDYYIIGEKVENAKVIGAGEALEAFCDAFNGILIEKDITVKVMTMEYVVELDDELDENNYRNAQLVPVWVIRYTGGMSHMPDYIESTMVISAIDGSVYRR